MPRLAALFLALALCAAPLGGCGSSEETTGSTPATPGAALAPPGASARSCEGYAVDAEALRATGIDCARARQVMYGWQRQRSCALPKAASRGSCLSRPYRCQAVRADRGVAVSCSRAGQSVAFIARSG